MLRGFSKGLTMLELAVAMTVVGILAAIAIPNYMNFMRDVRAAQAVADIQAVRAAVYLYFGDNQQWPPEEQAGVVPAELTPYLPRGMVFFKSAYKLDYDNWIVNGGGGLKSRFPQTGVLVGVSVISGDREMIKAAKSLLGGQNTVNLSPLRTTLVVASETGF